MPDRYTCIFVALYFRKQKYQGSDMIENTGQNLRVWEIDLTKTIFEDAKPPVLHTQNTRYLSP